ncbi:Caleosin related protein-domain-containing protein [Sporodiniella umbellata]|nr:Caleosin related protein-domain-containing protein [Sporodiniella umbellata]
METQHTDKDTHVLLEESGVQKHINFWDKRNKGYITPIDTINGFMTLGYSVIFSVALGTLAGIFLSLFSQPNWLPDPYCRSSVRNLVRSTQHTSGVYDKDGVFVSENFEKLFNKYSKSGESLTLAEFFRMKSGQEELHGNIKAWTLSMFELCTAYFFIGHRGSLSKEDVRAAYDGTLFYRLKDNDAVRRKMDASAFTPLAGSYLLSSRKKGIRFVENKLNTFLQTLSIGDVNLKEWLEYLKENTASLGENHRIMKRSSSGIQGVPAPKPDAIYSKKREVQTPEEPTCLTGVVQSDPVIRDESHRSLLGNMGVQREGAQGEKDEEEASRVLFENFIRVEQPPVSDLTGIEITASPPLTDITSPTLSTCALTGVREHEEGQMLVIVPQTKPEIVEIELIPDSELELPQSPPVEPAAITPPPEKLREFGPADQDAKKKNHKNKKKNSQTIPNEELSTA